MLLKPKFWDKKVNLISIILFPFTVIFAFLIYIRKKIIKSIDFKIPIICVGNIYIGGTGKTPVSIFLANEIQKIGKKPVILRKFYKNHQDEYGLIRNNFKNLILDSNRINGIRKIEKLNFDVVILDDGLQDYKIRKNISIACFNSTQLIGNGLLIPSGPLRESLSSLKNVEIVIVNGNKNEDFEKKLFSINPNLEIFYSKYIPTNIDDFKNKKLLAVAGIGNPENFFSLAEKNGLHIEKKLIFPDHYQFSKKEIKDILDEVKKNDYQIVMTEKDYFKFKHFKSEKIKYLKVSLQIDNHERLIKKIKELND